MTNPNNIQNIVSSGLEKLDPMWVTGIVDAEGNFSINYNEKTDKFSAIFKVTQKSTSLNMLVALKNFFNCGNIVIDNRETDGYKFNVSKLSDLIDIIIPHFDKYPLVGSKHLDFLSFKKAILLRKSVAGPEGGKNKDKILFYKNSMNKKRSYEERWNYLNKLSFNLHPAWVQAFVDGVRSGCFQCRIADTVSRNSAYVSVNPTLEIAQNSHDVEVLNAIKEYFGVGYLKPKYDIKDLNESKKSRRVNRLIINQEEVVINFFDKYPLLTSKNLDYSDWKLIIELKKKNSHRTSEGKQEMINIKLGMNSNRLLDTNIINISDKLKLINHNPHVSETEEE